MTVENMKPIKKYPLPPGETVSRPASSLGPARDSPYAVGRSRSLGRRPIDKPIHTTSSPSDTSDAGNSRMDFDDRLTIQHSDHSSSNNNKHSDSASSNNRHSDTASDIVLDAEKILPEGDDYKIVFISSDSSKDSELNSSIDSDNSGSPSRRVSSINTVNDSDNAGFIDESDWDYFESESQAGRKRRQVLNNNKNNNVINNNKNRRNNSTSMTPSRVIIPTRVDACVMTEGEYFSGTASEGEDSEIESTIVPDASLHFSLRVPSPELTPCHQRDDSGVSNATTESQELQVSFDDVNTSGKDGGTPSPPPPPPPAPPPLPPEPLLPTLSSLDTEELQAMLRQTEAVQAEAQALQAALMSAFTPSEAVMRALPGGGGRWFARGDSTRSSAERSMGEISCHDQVVRALGSSSHESPALREYRKRVLTEIQNYYGVNSDTTGRERNKLSDRQTARPDWYAYLAQHNNPSPSSPAVVTSNNQVISSPSLSYQQHRLDRIDKNTRGASQGGTDRYNNSSNSSKDVSPSVPVRNSRRKTSRDICIQTDPDPLGLSTVWDEEDLMIQEPNLSSAAPTVPVIEQSKGSLGIESNLPKSTTALSVSRLLERIPTGTRGYTLPSGHGGGGSSRLDGASVGIGGVHVARGVSGRVGAIEEGRRGEEVTSPYLPHPPSFHLHLTLSRETSVAHPSDSETDEKFVDESSCVSSDLGADSASDFEFREDESEGWRRPTVEQVPENVERGKDKATKKVEVIIKEEKEHGRCSRGYGEEEANVCPQIAAAASASVAAITSDTPTSTSTAANILSKAVAPSTHHTHSHPPQPAPRRNMSALRPHLASTQPHPHSNNSLPSPLPQVPSNGGDLDAHEGVIPPTETTLPLPLEDEDVSSRSSTGSDAEDTDEDVHVSKSYDICGGNDSDKDSETEILPVDEISNHLESEQRENSSSSSGSDTDEDKHVSKEYRLTKSSSTETEFEKYSDEEAEKDIADVSDKEKDVSLSECLSVSLNEEVIGGQNDNDNDVSVVTQNNTDKNEVANDILSDLIINNDNNIMVSEPVCSNNTSDSNISDDKDVSNINDNSNNIGNNISLSFENEERTENDDNERVENDGNENLDEEENVNKENESDKEMTDENEPLDVKENGGGIIENVNTSFEKRIDECYMNVENDDVGVGDVEEGSVGDGESEEGEVVEKHDVESTTENLCKESRGEITSVTDNDNSERADSDRKHEYGHPKEPCLDIENDVSNKDSVLENIDVSEMVKNESNVVNDGDNDDITHTTITDDGNEPLSADLPDSYDKEDRNEDLSANDPSSEVSSPKSTESVATEVSECCDVECPSLLEGTAGYDISESDQPPRESKGLERDAEKLETSVVTSTLGESLDCTSGTSADTGSAEVEQTGGGTEHTPVTDGSPEGTHVPPQPLLSTNTTDLSSTFDVIDTTLSSNSTLEDTVIEWDGDIVKEEEKEKKVDGESSESGHSSAGESEVEGEEDPANIVKISVTEGHDDDGVSIPVSILDSEGVKQEVTRFAVRRVRSPEVTSRRTPPVPSRRNKRSSSSDGVSSSSDIERSDADASDSADTVVEGGKRHAELRRFALQQRINDQDDKNRDSDGPSSADSVLHGADSESQCSDNSEEGNLVSIVSVGDEDDHTNRLSSHGRIYIRSDSTDSDVQIKPTCIVVTGSSGAESGDDGEGEKKGDKTIRIEGNDITILEVTSDGHCGHVMSVHVTSPDSSRSASPARRSQVSELQSMILTTRERQSQFRRSPTEMKENTSSLANYFTRTLGTDSPHAPRRLNKTPEIRR
ncbi:hypothetical protein SK128_027397, partial [Halocaridina rubra]